MSKKGPQTIIEQVVREEWGRALSILVSQIRDIELAEDALQDAVLVALEKWDANIPQNPCAWLISVAKRRMIDQVRRRENFRSKESEIVNAYDFNDPQEFEDEEPIPDHRLKLIFACCHPAIAEESRVALTLQTLGGLKTSEVAKAFLVPEATMAQRLVRAKRKIKVARIPYEVPPEESLPERFSSVLATIYLIFNEGYASSTGANPIRLDLCNEAIRLCRVLTQIAPEHAEAKGLLALLLLHHSRSAARIDSQGNFVTLEHQDRSLWDRELAGQGLLILEEALSEKETGPYQLQAAISALHIEAETYESTDWQQIYLLYERLHSLQPSPIVKLNQIVALSFAGGPEAALDALEAIRDHPKLQTYLPMHAAEADFYRRAGMNTKAANSYRRALQLAKAKSETAFFQSRLKEVEQ